MANAEASRGKVAEGTAEAGKGVERVREVGVRPMNRRRSEVGGGGAPVGVGGWQLTGADGLAIIWA